jgi:endonuclease/exonuclease/phosphatase family metal-dependent hydrolase
VGIAPDVAEGFSLFLRIPIFTPQARPPYGRIAEPRDSLFHGIPRRWTAEFVIAPTGGRMRLKRLTSPPFMPFRFAPLLFLVFCFLVPARGAQEIVVASYNLENYVSASPREPGERAGARAKSEKEIAAIIRIVKEINPDILGVCEMGSPERFEDFKKRLNEEGLGYMASEYVSAADDDRHLALVSRFPIVARNSRSDVPFELGGRPEKVLRGILDVTVEVNPGYRLRLVGVHLKSKLPIPAGEALVRRMEAEQLRKHLDGILTAVPDTNLVCYGDFNDTKNQPAIQEIMGPRNSPFHMADLWARDEVGDKWTHYWKTADEYSRIDYIFVSPALFREVVLAKSRVYRSEFWNDASDHRPVFTTIIAKNKK